MELKNKTGRLFVVSAPSGAGKTTLVTLLIDRIGEKYNIERVVTYTTRAPRAGDTQKKDYHFISREEFELLIDRGFFIEWSAAYGNYYGTPSSIIGELATGKSLILIVDRAGVQSIAHYIPYAIFILIVPPSEEVLKKRLILRGSEEKNEISHRLLLAKEEISTENVNSLYKYHVINDSLVKAVDDLAEIVKKEL
jgi:guanylate kinase